MGVIDRKTDPERDLSIITAGGELTAREIRQGIEEYYAGTATRLILWDFSSADLSRIKAEEVSYLVQLTLQFRDRRPSGKTALVLPSDLAFGMGRMFEMLADLQGGTPSEVDYRSFRNGDEALTWLQGMD